MSFMVWIIEELIAVEEWFYEAYQEVKDWIYPFYLLKYPLYGLYGTFHWLAEAFYEFYQWLEWAAEQLEDILSWTYIRSLIRSWLYGIEEALTWFLNWTYWVRQEINEWWQLILLLVLDYVDSAVEGLDSLKVAWDYFWEITFPSLVSFDWLGIWWNDKLTDIQALIHTAIQELAPFWEGWQEVRSEVVEFFSDPLQWVYNKLDEFFERFW